MDNNDKILLDANRQIDELKEKLNSLEKEKYRYDKKNRKFETSKKSRSVMWFINISNYYMFYINDEFNRIL